MFQKGKQQWHSICHFRMQAASKTVAPRTSARACAIVIQQVELSELGDFYNLKSRNNDKSIFLLNFLNFPPTCLTMDIQGYIFFFFKTRKGLASCQ
jgi:hypothetical protein